MKILVTGANGFIGKNLIRELNNRGYEDIYRVTRETGRSLLEKYTKDCDFVFHLAGVNRPKKEKEFMEVNFGFTSELLELLKEKENRAPILIASSIQAKRKNPYAVSKKAGEDLLFKYGQERGVKVFVYRLPNLFGKWSRPNYNSVVATFCHNIARDMDIRVNNPKARLKLCYIDDVVDSFIKDLDREPEKKQKFCQVYKVHYVRLSRLAELIESFKASREDLVIPNMEDEFTKKLYSTYLSYLPEDEFAYELKMNEDHRGSFTELLKAAEMGQISINISKPGITKGNHWHHSKNEKFIVVKGEGIIQFRNIDRDKKIEYRVSGENIKVVDIPVGYTHNIVNVGKTDLVTVMWANESFDPENPDTYSLEV